MRLAAEIPPYKVVDRVAYYPQYCTACQLPFFSEQESEACPYCFSKETINHNGEMYSGKDKHLE